MKLLFDHNLSPRLVDRLADLFPGSTHLYTLDMDRDEDRQVWIYSHLAPIHKN
jgi:predicted nuclease of predicted toxin-antitoxin system